MDSERETHPTLEIHLLGGFRAQVNGVPVPNELWERRKTKALVRILAVEPTHRVHREHLQEILWPDVDPRSANSGFRKVLHLARHAFEPKLKRGTPSSFLSVRDDVVILESSRTWIDADEFESLATEALTTRAIANLEAALALYGGELLPEDRYEDWAGHRRDTLNALHLQILSRVAEYLAAHGEYASAIKQVRAALLHNPGQEALHRQLMQLYAADGSRHLALRQYQLCRQALDEEFEALPDEETEACYAQIRANGTIPIQDEPAFPAAIRQYLKSPLIGRDRALEVLLAELSAAEGTADDRCGTVLVSGEAGVGKTRLIVEMARRAAKLGRPGRGPVRALVLWGTSYDLENRMPYGAFIEALSTWADRLPVNAREQIAESYEDILPLLPGLGRPGQQRTSPFDARTERMRLFASVARLLADIAVSRPVLLVLDDLHTADPATVQLLHHLIRLAPDHKWLIVSTYREEDVAPGSPLHALLCAVRRAGQVRHLDLLRLAQPDCDRFVEMLLTDGSVDEALQQRVYSMSLGNPLFAGELVASMLERREIVLKNRQWKFAQTAPDDRFQSVPQKIGDLIDARVRSLGDEAVRTLSIAAAIGMEVSFPVLSAAAREAYPCSLPEEIVLDALDRALTARIFEERADDYVFRHPLYREALYERLSRPRRAHLHRAIARALERTRPDDVEALAFHYARTDDAEKAIVYTERAGDRASALYANDLALAHYSDMLARLESLGHHADVLRVREKLGAVLRLMRRYGDALAVLEPVSRVDTLDWETSARVVAQIGRLHALAGTPGVGESRIRELLHSEPYGAPPRGRAELNAALAHVYFASGKYHDQLAAADEAVRLAADAEDAQLIAEAEGRRGLALMLTNEQERAAKSLQQTIGLARAGGDLDTLYRALNNMSSVWALLGQMKCATEYCIEALEVAEQIGDPSSIAFALCDLSGFFFLMGRTQESHDLVDRALKLGQSSVSGWHKPYIFLTYGNRQLAAGAAGAREWFDQALQLATDASDLHALRLAAVSLATLDTLEGHAEHAVDRLESLFTDAHPADVSTHWIRAELAQAHLQLGNLDRAEALICEGQRWFQDSSTQTYTEEFWRVIGLLHAKQGRLAEAREDFDHAAALARDLQSPYREAVVLMDQGHAWVSAGLEREGQELLSAARTRWEELGLFGKMRLIDRTLATAPQSHRIP